MPALAQEEFIQMFKEKGAKAVAQHTGQSERSVYSRRAALEKSLDVAIGAPSRPENTDHPQRVQITIKNGTAIVGSDGHYWPGKPSTIHRALVKFLKDIRPTAFVFNGDAFDGARISRHPPIGWEKRPTVVEELEACQERMTELSLALPKQAKRIWTLGNHDARFETRLATVAPDYANIQGMHLKDHFVGWDSAWSCFINDDVVVKHRFKGGMHAPQNNTLWSGRTTVTGHLHSAKVQPITDYNGTRYGVDTGCIADPEGPQFTDYTEDNPLNWRSAFGVFTFKDGELLLPELCIRWDKDHVQFRGEIIRV